MTRREKIIQTYAKKFNVDIEEAEFLYTEEMRKRASKGGKAKVPKGFAKNKELAREAGRKGGKATKKDFINNET